ncbi:hypothetical protein MLD38_004011 [Melastoma candidum]|uniref:Uncharacterized protein n=1 Tax=Melastoma candidum TaxID=119954 RepID=A0ACB9S4H1_9MYRT|nr:hypothetical protein MLD38_004011 [Melastoma candidum]
MNLSGSSGLPICIPGITLSIPFPKQMADHDRRRKSVIKKLRSLPRGANGEGTAAGSRHDADEDLSNLMRELCRSIPLPRAARAA